MVVARVEGWGGQSDGGQKVKFSNYKINKWSRCNIQHGDWVNKTVFESC